jgi:hypothetical protein
MNLKPTLLKCLLAGCAVAVLVSPAPAFVLDLTTAGASGSIGAAFFQQVNNQPTGTGVIDSFLRMQANGSEQGVNSPGPYLMDEKPGLFTHAIHVSDFGVVDHSGTPSIRVLLDINETAAAPLLSWDQLMFFTAPVATYNTVAQLQTNGSLIYNMDAGGDNSAHLNYLLDDGSGSGDVLTYLPASLLAGHTTEWLYLYSQFGAEGGDYVSNDGFEEFARVDNPIPPPPPVPEPMSLLLLGGGLIGLVGFRAVRKHRG